MLRWVGYNPVSSCTCFVTPTHSTCLIEITIKLQGRNETALQPYSHSQPLRAHSGIVLKINIFHVEKGRSPCPDSRAQAQQKLAMTTSLEYADNCGGSKPSPHVTCRPDCVFQSGNMGAINPSRIQLRNPAYELSGGLQLSQSKGRSPRNRSSR